MSSIMTVLVLFGFVWSFHALTQEERNIVVEFHNALRSNVDPPAANMEKMVSRLMNKLIRMLQHKLIKCGLIGVSLRPIHCFTPYLEK